MSFLRPLTAAGVVAAALLVPVSSSAAEDTGTVHIVHGLPDVPADIAVDGTVVLDDLSPETARGPLELPAGEHSVTVLDADTGAQVLAGTTTVSAGGSTTVLAHLSETGEPTLTTFDNDISALPPGSTRLIVRHGAAAPPVQVRADGTVAIDELSNGEQEEVDLPAGFYPVELSLIGSESVIIEPWAEELEEGTTTVVQAVGTAEDLAMVVLVLDGMASAPGGVPAGTGPTTVIPPELALGVLALGGLLVFVSGRALATTPAPRGRHRA